MMPHSNEYIEEILSSLEYDHACLNEEIEYLRRIVSKSNNDRLNARLSWAITFLQEVNDKALFRGLKLLEVEGRMKDALTTHKGVIKVMHSESREMIESLINDMGTINKTLLKIKANDKDD